MCMMPASCEPSAFRLEASGLAGPSMDRDGIVRGARRRGRRFPRHAGRSAAFEGAWVTAIELMPVNDFPGKRNWGYDGVLPYAPDTAYGQPDELKELVDAAHGLGLMMFLDVVYNHFGPDGNYIGAYAPQFFRDDVKTPWGPAIDFRRPEVRDYFTCNVLMWLTEFRFDGLRFDAVHAIQEQDWVQEMAATVRSDGWSGPACASGAGASQRGVASVQAMSMRSGTMTATTCCMCC